MNICSHEARYSTDDFNDQEWVKDNLPFRVFEVPGVCIGLSNCRIDLPAGQHAHSDYEFMMPLTGKLVSGSEKKVIVTSKFEAVPFNSEQLHGPTDDVSLDGFICLTCSKEKMFEISDQVFAKSEIIFSNESFHVSSDIRVLLGLLVEESLGKPAGYEFIQENLVNVILFKLIRSAKSNLSQAETEEKSHDVLRIEQAADFLRGQYRSEFSLNEVAHIADLSPYHFIRVFKAHTGKTPYEFLLEVKIEKAKQLLSHKNLTITDICLSCGFNNPSHFSLMFKRKIGVSPSEYRKLIE